MNILFFSRLFYPHIGGVEKHVERISLELIKKNHEVTVLTEKFDNKLSSSEVINKISITRINPGGNDWFKKFRIWKNVWKNRKLIADADVIHVHDVFFWYLPFRFLFWKKKVYVTFHGYEGDSIPGLKAKLMHKIAEKLSRGNICVGDFLEKWYGTKPDYVTYGAVEVSSIKYPSFVKASAGRQVLSKNKNKLKFLFIGRLEEETGVMEYLKTLVLLKKDRYKFKLTVLGDGSLRKKAEDFSKVNKINAKFKGFVENVENYLPKADFIFTSRYLGILEALSYKKFIFTHYNNSIKKDYLEIVPFAEFISVSADCEQLSLSIEYFLKNDKKRNKMIDEGFNWVKNQTWENLTNLYIHLWKKE